MPSPGPLGAHETPGPAASPLEIGQVVAGKYRIERLIGRGGMGVVLAATHLQLEHQVAIKVMRRDLLEDERAVERLLFEARSAARIRSEHVARVLDVGTLEGGSPFIVMEYLQGENLGELLDRQGALDVEAAVGFLLECCEALAEVHVAEMVHRDLKPGNLFIARLPDGSPTLKIVDFGISKYIGGAARERGAVTSPQVLGSPFYMAPEQMRADLVDERSDIWALGAILFEMVCARPPFVADTLPEVYAAVLGGAPPSLEQLRPGLPAGLDDVVQRCLEKDPAQRFCDVAELAEALAPFGRPEAAQRVERITRILANPEAIRSRHSGAPGSLAAALMDQPSSRPSLQDLGSSTPPELRALSATGEAGASGVAPGRSRRWGWAALGVAALALTGVIVRRGGSPPAAPARAVLRAAPLEHSPATVASPAAGPAALSSPTPAVIPAAGGAEQPRDRAVSRGTTSRVPRKAGTVSRRRTPRAGASGTRRRVEAPLATAGEAVKPSERAPLEAAEPSERAPLEAARAGEDSPIRKAEPAAAVDPWDPKSFGGRR